MEWGWTLQRPWGYDSTTGPSHRSQHGRSELVQTSRSALALFHSPYPGSVRLAPTVSV